MDACEADELRDQLETRLRAEDEEELADKLAGCGEPFSLTCTNCGVRHEITTSCKRKWCPACLRWVAGRRSARFRGAVSEMRWPLFVTLTQPNSDDPESVRHLRAAFGKLRHRKLWTSRTTGGVASIEVTNIGNGWHPHLHAVIDCEWLAAKTPPPDWQRGSAHVAERCRAAQEELSAVWRRCLGAPEAIVHVKRCNKETITQEVVKYSVKGVDLLDSPDPIGDMIRVLERTRLITTFGTFFGRGREFDEEASKDKPGCGECGEVGAWIPTEVAEILTRTK